MNPRPPVARPPTAENPPRWRAWMGLVHDAVDATTGLVGEGHASAARVAMALTDRLGPISRPARAVDGVRRASTEAVLAAVRGVNRGVEASVGAALDAWVPPSDPMEPVPLRSDAIGSAAWMDDAALGLLNGAIGNELSGPLDLGMQLRPGRPGPGGELVVLVHGLATTEWSWCLDALAFHGDPAATFGTLLERDLGLSPVYARYNTGRPVRTNGLALAERLEALHEAWRPTRIVLLGHSMGGLVARSAGQAARVAGHAWLERLTHLVTLSSPHRGAPLAGFASLATSAFAAVDLPATQVLARILEARSRGIHDLAEAAEEPLLPHVRYTFVGATSTRDPDHPLGAALGDWLVRPSSASGPAGSRAATRTLGGVLHHQVQCHPEVYAVVRDALGEPPPGPASPAGHRPGP